MMFAAAVHFIAIQKCLVFSTDPAQKPTYEYNFFCNIPTCSI